MARKKWVSGRFCLITPQQEFLPGNSAGHWNPGKGKQPKIYLPKKVRDFFKREAQPYQPYLKGLNQMVKVNMD